MRLVPLLLLLIGVGTAAAGQVRPQPGTGDPRLQTVEYHADQIVQLQGTPGYELMVELSPDEQVVNVAVGDAGSWQANVNHQGDHLFIKPTQAAAPTNMTVITTVRVYNFELFPVSGPAVDVPFSVRFQYPAEAEPAPGDGYVDVGPLKRALSRYRVSGDRSLRPDSISDDGTHTYIRWSRDKAIPAVYSIGDSGEVLVSGWMRDDTYVIDGIVQRLSFRIDDKSARAVRLTPRKHR
jgi:type IV secretion system protein VirB9